MSQYPLTIYEASAGSGKTYTLALRYIELLIINPENYKYILAVTFTNKATDEMKTRILAKLYGLANRLSDSDDFMTDIRRTNPNLSEELIRHRAAIALEEIITHYSLFRVMTIDSFFQMVMRGLARELGLTSNLKVEINSKEVAQKAVDSIVENLPHDKDGTKIMAWIMDFVTQQLDEGKDWNVLDKIKAFSDNVFKEHYQEKSADIEQAVMDNPHIYENYYIQMRRLIKEAETAMSHQAQQFEQIQQQLNVDDGYFSGKYVPSYFAKMKQDKAIWCDKKRFPGKSIQNIVSQPSKMLRTKDAETPEGKKVIAAVTDLLKTSEEVRTSCVATVNTALLSMGKLQELRLLKRIEQEIKHINEEANSFTLDSTKQLLSALISDSDSPFIYEKIGGIIKYIMIDEFQDTSLAQWKNFNVLVNECISHNKGSLIVGDIKQSIYRWRSGNWQTLAKLTTEKDHRIHAQSLEYNHRSEQNIIQFNNAFFQTAPSVIEQILAEKEITVQDEQIKDIQNVYKHAVQKVPHNKENRHNGAVSIRFLDEGDHTESMIQLVKSAVEELLEAGIARKDIAVITRSNDQIKDLALWFQQNPITVHGKQMFVRMVSDMAFRLDSSTAVLCMVNVMKLLLAPTDTLLHENVRNIWINDCAQKTDMPIDRDVIRRQLLQLPLSDMAHEIYRLMQLYRIEKQSAYVCTFFDKLRQYEIETSGSLKDFLEEWDAHLCQVSIHSAEIDGIRMITIHKSKGLEFDNIIIPYCDWQIESIKDLLWVEPEKSPFNNLPYIPIALQSGKLLNSYYRPQYLAEHVMNIIDNINLLYVAFTRARTNLYVFGKYNNNFMVQLIRNTLSKIAAQNNSPYQLRDDKDGKDLCFEFGRLYVAPKPSAEESANVFKPYEQQVEAHFVSNPSKAVFLQSNESSQFVTPEEDNDTRQQYEYIKTGNVIHKLFAQIQSVDDIDRAIGALQYDGTLYGEQMTKEQLKQLMTRLLQNREINTYFTKNYAVINERNILTTDVDGNMAEYRPDRVVSDGTHTVVIDFKTGDKHKNHHRQVQQYMLLLDKMGYKNVKGLLWYLKSNTVENV